MCSVSFRIQRNAVLYLVSEIAKFGYVRCYNTSHFVKLGKQFNYHFIADRGILTLNTQLTLL